MNQRTLLYIAAAVAVVVIIKHNNQQEEKKGTGKNVGFGTGSGRYVPYGTPSLPTSGSAKLTEEIINQKVEGSQRDEGQRDGSGLIVG